MALYGFCWCAVSWKLLRGKQEMGPPQTDFWFVWGGAFLIPTAVQLWRQGVTYCSCRSVFTQDQGASCWSWVSCHVRKFSFLNLRNRMFQHYQGLSATLSINTATIEEDTRLLRGPQDHRLADALFKQSKTNNIVSFINNRCS